MLEYLHNQCSRRELRKQDRRQAILEAARDSFLEHGYAGTSMSGLLKTLGGSKATLWGYFRCKEDLFAAVVSELSGAFRAELCLSLAQTDEVRDSLRTFCRSFLHMITSPSTIAAWRLVVAESGRFPEVGRIFYENAARLTETMLSDLIKRHIERGDLRREDPLRMARELIGLCTSRLHRILWGVEQADAASLDADAAHFAELFLRAYEPAIPFSKDAADPASIPE